MANNVGIEVHHHLERTILGELLPLIDEATRAEGHRPLGEHKFAQLEAGAQGWSGVVARDGAGRAVGYAHVRWVPPGHQPRAAMEVVVHPSADRDGAVAALVAEVAGLVAGAGGGLLWWWMHRVEDPAATEAVRHGFAVQRELAFMQRPLESPPEPGAPPPGIVLRPYRGEVDDAEFLRVNNRAFEGHPENGGWSAEEFAARRKLAWFDPADLLMAWRGEQLAGFHWTKRHEQGSDEVPGDEPVGEVYVLAVDPGAQRTGLGRYLLDAGLAHLHDRGCRFAVLYVDRATAGAVHLYARNGFAVLHHEVCYERVVQAGDGGSSA